MLLLYFEDTYIGRFRRNAPPRPPAFPIELLSSFPEQVMLLRGGTEDSKPNVSAFHRTFWKLLDVLKKEDQGGHQPPPQRRNYADCNLRILQILDDYPNHRPILTDKH